VPRSPRFRPELTSSDSVLATFWNFAPATILAALWLSPELRRRQILVAPADRHARTLHPNQDVARLTSSRPFVCCVIRLQASSSGLGDQVLIYAFARIWSDCSRSAFTPSTGQFARLGFLAITLSSAICSARLRVPQGLELRLLLRRQRRDNLLEHRPRNLLEPTVITTGSATAAVAGTAPVPIATSSKSHAWHKCRDFINSA
jgi:hypothetical protein